MRGVAPNLIRKVQKQIQDDPILIYDHILGCAHWSKQDEITESIFKYQRTTVPSCHGAGKSYTMARVATAFLIAHPDSIVVTTAPTFRQVENVIWREIRGAVNTAKVNIGVTPLKTRLEFSDNWYAIGISSDKPDKIQGFHAKSGHILIIVDEAAGVGDEILEAVEGLLTSKDVHLVYIGNPTSGSGRFYDSAKSKYFNKIKISAFDTPNFKFNRIRSVEDLEKYEELSELEALPLPYPQLVTPAWAWLRMKEWGAESSVFRARVAAEFPEEGADTLIPLIKVEKAIAKEIDPEDRKKWPRCNVVGVDVARYGDDLTSIIALNNYEQVAGESYNGKDTMETVGRVIRVFTDAGFDKDLDLIAVDDTGVGGGVTDRLVELGYNVLPVVLGAGAENKEEYLNLRAEIMWNMRDLFMKEKIKLLNWPKFLSQVPSIKYKFLGAKLQIESKENMKKRGLPSPDESDALAIGLWAAKSFSTYGKDSFEADGETEGGDLWNKEF